MTCGTANRSECTQSVYVWKVGDDYLIGFRGEVNEDPRPPGHGRPERAGQRHRRGRRRRPPRRHQLLRPRDAEPGARLRQRRAQRPRHAADHQPVARRRRRPGLRLLEGRRRRARQAAVPRRRPRPHRRHPEHRPRQRPPHAAGQRRGLDRRRHRRAGHRRPRRRRRPRQPRHRRRERLRRRRRRSTSSGLAQGSITYRADADGSFADGIRIWAGSGNDTFVVDGTHRRAGLRTTTWLNTGLGNDHLVGRPPQRARTASSSSTPRDRTTTCCTSASTLSDGDEPVSGDTTTVTVNGVVDPAGPLRGQHPGTHRRPVRLLPPG